MRGLTDTGDDGSGHAGDGEGGNAGDGGLRGPGGTSGSRPGTRWAASGTAAAGLVAFGLLLVSCSTGGTGTRDEGPAGAQVVTRVTPSPSTPSTVKPPRRVDVVRLVKKDPKVSGPVREELKPCTGDEYPVDTSYGTLTGGSAADVVVNVMTCGDAVGIGTYVYRARADGTYENVFTTETPTVYGTIDRGDLVVTTQVYGRKDAIAYPSGEEVITYRWAKTVFAEYDRVHNDFNRAAGNGEGVMPDPVPEPTRN
ncbi:hypothetical protein PZB75_12565 [Streptomyces sp. AM 4-1-1]|uniref:hypothetical protein n=1 Tax=Streptomyces sp. AM 4-1-1 TaxID=3028710 RepID=UPI0023B98ED4|nr:hypothetical protein [Streptomyces sp. AM 4-1-1]WEH34122.1 hypothetical protein PZB75_12565 [Streptomyces sp. AM 4-1-1]